MPAIVNSTGRKYSAYAYEYGETEGRNKATADVFMESM